MKAVVFAGGGATRLSKSIGGYNKHLMPLGRTLVVEQGIRDLRAGGVTEFLVITNRGWEEDFRHVLIDRVGIDGDDVKVVASSAPKLPLPDVLLEAEGFVGRERFLLYLGDNLFLRQQVLRTERKG